MRLSNPDEPRAIFEARLAGGVHLWDVSHLLPHTRRKRKKRDVSKIDRLFFHHSGRLGRAGFEGCWRSAHYVVNQRRKPDGTLAKFPGPAYTFWIPAEDVRDSSGALVVYRCNPDSERSYHTGGRANIRGVAAVFQGNTTKRPLTHSHHECSEALIPWSVDQYALAMPEGLSWHSVAKRDGARKNKPACPGKHAVAWLEEYVAA